MFDICSIPQMVNTLTQMVCKPDLIILPNMSHQLFAIKQLRNLVIHGRRAELLKCFYSQMVGKRMLLSVHGVNVFNCVTLIANFKALLLAHLISPIATHHAHHCSLKCKWNFLWNIEPRSIYYKSKHSY